MNHKPEVLITFPPKKGATGACFIDGKPRYTKRLSDQKGQWDSKLRMTIKLKKLVHKDLKWIFSMPLFDISDQNTILGVLNIDCLRCNIKQAIVEQELFGLIGEFYAIMDCLADVKRKKVKLYK